jgi:hypothetical protein
MKTLFQNKNKIILRKRRRRPIQNQQAVGTHN